MSAIFRLNWQFEALTPAWQKSRTQYQTFLKLGKKRQIPFYSWRNVFWQGREKPEKKLAKKKLYITTHTVWKSNILSDDKPVKKRGNVKV